MKITRYHAAANHLTFNIKPIREMIERYIRKGDVIVDPFARNSMIGTYRNDLNPDTKAQWHLRAEDFCDVLKQKKIVADVCFFDPPYSSTQAQKHYQSFGMTVTQKDTQMARLYRVVKLGLHKLLKPHGIVICCGWNSGGMPKYRGYERIETMLICHGSTHYDTIVTVDRKPIVNKQKAQRRES